MSYLLSNSNIIFIYIIIIILILGAVLLVKNKSNLIRFKVLKLYLKIYRGKLNYLSFILDKIFI